MRLCPANSGKRRTALNGFSVQTLLLCRRREAKSAQHREHVTLYVLDHPAMFKTEALLAPPALWYPEIRLDVDYEEDLTFLERICALLRPAPEADWTTREIVELLLAKPELLPPRQSESSAPMSLNHICD